MRVRRAAVVLEDLHFVAAAQADAAVAVGPDAEFGIEFKVPELAVRDEVVGFRGVDEDAVFHLPAERGGSG